ncbi:MAG TPA: hypothetical protein VFZ14_03415 [Burkholderiales bacterium]|nr:hypothetical protein [Burkholderiales bacterium]
MKSMTPFGIAGGVVLCAAGFLLDRRAMLQAYLFAWLVVLGVSLGALANLMVHTLSGGRWGEAVRPAFVSAARTLPLVALLYIPVALGQNLLYPDAGTYFRLRSVAWLIALVALAGWWLHADRRAAARTASAAGLIVYAVTMSFAAFDWIAALEPTWYSSGFGLVVGVGQMLGGMAFGVAAAHWLHSGPRGEVRRAVFHDLGNLLLMYVLTWAYLAFTQFLIIWAENLPREISWYLPRTTTSWFWLGVALVVVHFCAPLAILLSRTVKRSPRVLATVAGALFLAHVADVFWLVIPGFRREGFAVTVFDLLASVGIALIWGAAWYAAISSWTKTYGMAR